MADNKPEEVNIHYVGYKADNSPFSSDEILALNISFVRWAESEGLFVGGGIGPCEKELDDSSEELNHASS